MRFVAGPDDLDTFAQELGEQLVVEHPVQGRDPGVPGRQGTVSVAPLRLQPLFLQPLSLRGVLMSAP